METQTCKYCGEEKEIDQFEVANTIKGKTYRRKKCSVCKAKDKEARRDRLRQWWSEFKKDLKCKKCGEDRWYILDFHHRDPNEKDNSLGNAMQQGWGKERILREVSKCDVYCANCHREFHYLEQERRIA